MAAKTSGALLVGTTRYTKLTLDIFHNRSPIKWTISKVKDLHDPERNEYSKYQDTQKELEVDSVILSGSPEATLVSIGNDD